MNYAALIKSISTATAQLQGRAAAALNQALVIRNWMTGAWIVEFEQSGKDRAKYGVRLLETLAHDLKARGLKGMDERTLLDCRTVYRLYPQIPGSLTTEFQTPGSVSAIPGSVTPELAKLLRNQRLPSIESKPSHAIAIRGSLTRELPTALEPAQVLRLSWTHLQEMIRIDDPWKRAFFENECLNSRWSVRQLQRQIGSLLYERTGLSANKKAVIERARKQASPRRSASCCAATRMALKSNSPRPAWIKNCSSRAISRRCRRWRNCARFSKRTASGLKVSCRRLAAQPSF